MLSRCTNPHHKNYADYGGRGITVSEAWRHSFETFASDMGEPPESAMTLERIDNNGPYSKENCRWATREEQAQNTRQNRLITYNGITRPLVGWAKHLGIKRTILKDRFSSGWSVEDALTTPVKKRG
jgi:hypothetical protein